MLLEYNAYIHTQPVSGKHIHTSVGENLILITHCNGSIRQVRAMIFFLRVCCICGSVQIPKTRKITFVSDVSTYDTFRIAFSK